MITVTALGLDSQNVSDYGNGDSLTLSKFLAFSMPTERRNVNFFKTLG
jgi:hypothetical protein